MRSNQSTTKKSNVVKVRKLYSKPVLIILLCLLAILIRGTWGVFQKERASRQNAAMVMSELETLKERKNVLEDETTRLSTEEGVEEALREKFQVSKDDEQVMVIVRKSLPVDAMSIDEGFFSKVWGSVSNIFKKDTEIDATSTPI